MGKDQKGKELGKGISQRKDGYYVGRYTSKAGERQQRLFKQLQDCRKWVADSEYQDHHSDINKPQEMTVDSWYQVWIEYKEKTVTPNTLHHYRDRYRNDIQPEIGNMPISKVRALHCQRVLNTMADKGKRTGTIRDTRIVMRNLFEYAVENDLIDKNPCNNSVKADIGTPSKDRNILTEEQERIFLSGIHGSQYELQFRLVLQTGLRCGELCGLKWSDIDFKNRALSVERTMDCRQGIWRTGSPKSKCSRRKIPLTDEAINILRLQKNKDKRRNIVNLEWSDLVFQTKNGCPISNGAYDSALRVICRDIGVPQMSMHLLRHTFATRCIESDIKPKTLQAILGHSSINMTMDLYVHMTEDEKQREILKLKAV